MKRLGLLLLLLSPVVVGSDKITSLKVTATAYNSLSTQTDSTPDIAAWGDRLKPGMKAIAVSRDLLKQYGLRYMQSVTIYVDGIKLPDKYKVMDKMHPRKNRQIDIYMGYDKDKALTWGRREAIIEYQDH